jgi:outer membrane immunogenic protein
MRKHLNFAFVFCMLAGGVVGASGGARAADMAVKAPVYKAPPVAVSDWTGWYVGLNAGGAIDNSRYELDPTGCFLTGCGVGGVAANPNRTFFGKFNNAAFTGGGQVGYNWQVGTWLWGLETDINYDGLSQTNSANTILTGPLAGANTLTSVSQRLDWFGTVRGRIGFVPSPTWLLYATGGLAYGHVSSSTNVLFPITCCGGDNYVGSGSTVRAGWTVGGGGEWMFMQNWSVKAEYLYVNLGSLTYNDACITPTAVCGTPFPTYSTRVSTREHVARLGINYHFGAPVVAKY